MHIQITDFGTAKVLSADSRQGLLLLYDTNNYSKWSFENVHMLYLPDCDLQILLHHLNH